MWSLNVGGKEEEGGDKPGRKLIIYEVQDLHTPPYTEINEGYHYSEALGCDRGNWTNDLGDSRRRDRCMLFLACKEQGCTSRRLNVRETGVRYHGDGIYLEEGEGGKLKSKVRSM